MELKRVILDEVSGNSQSVLQPEPFEMELFRQYEECIKSIENDRLIEQSDKDKIIQNQLRSLIPMFDNFLLSSPYFKNHIRNCTLSINNRLGYFSSRFHRDEKIHLTTDSIEIIPEYPLSFFFLKPHYSFSYSDDLNDIHCLSYFELDSFGLSSYLSNYLGTIEDILHDNLSKGDGMNTPRVVESTFGLNCVSYHYMYSILHGLVTRNRPIRYD